MTELILQTAKLKTREEVALICEKAREEGKIVGYTSGVFDLLHAGHVDYLAQSRGRCDLLVVGVNSDASVRANKGDLRPICREAERATVLSGLQSVDYIFVFDEHNNNLNVELLKPAVYFKAGDYSRGGLSSAPLVEKHGGKVEIVPALKGCSSSSIIDRVIERFIGRFLVETALPPQERKPAVFLDRDGTINEFVEYLGEPADFRLIPGAVDALKRLKEAGFYLVITTNQPGIGLGYFSREDFFRVTRELLKAASKAGVMFDKIYFCPHGAAQACNCRKPATGMIERALSELNIDFDNSVVVGDTTGDVLFAKNAGCRSLLVETGQAGKDARYQVTPDHVAPDLPRAADWIIETCRTDRIDRTKAGGPVLPSKLGPQALEAIGYLGGKIGHDFNNFLGVIRGCVDIIKRKMGQTFPDGSPVDRQIAIIESAIEKSVDLTGKLRGFVRPGPLPKTAASLLSCAKSVVEVLRNSGVDLIVEAKSNPTVDLNEFSVQQALTAVVFNALEALQDMADRHLIMYLAEVEQSADNPWALSPGRYARLSITDHGRGIKPELLPKIFEPFFSTKSKGPGQALGLGLTMAREIMRKHGGDLCVDSREGCGTAVSLYFPMRTGVKAS